MVAEALFVTSALLVAVTLTHPAVCGAEKAAVVTVWLVNDPAEVVHVTPALPISFATAAVKVSDCESVRPPRLGVMDTEIADPDAWVEAVAVAEKLLRLPAASAARTR